MAERRRIVIVGGGPAGLATALSLTDPELHPHWRDEYEVTVLQMGWRLGGKGATGRRGTIVPDGDGGWRLEGDARIQEHGIHLFGNMYTNAMRMLDQCLQELPPSPTPAGEPIGDQLVPSNYLQLADVLDRRWEITGQVMPHNDLDPWGPQDYPGPLVLVAELLDLVVTLVEEAFGHSVDPSGHAFDLELHARALRRAAERERAHPSAPDPEHHAPALSLLEETRRRLAAEVDRHEGTSRYARIRSVWCQVELYTTLARGVVADEIFTAGLATVDGEDYIAWCRRHGMAEAALTSSVVQVAAQICFQFPQGDVSLPPTMAASSFLWFALRQLLSCGQGSYWFTRGTGDTVVAPFYRVAAERGVDFQFFRNVREISYDPATGAVDRIEVDVQATTVDGAPYDPLVLLPDGTLGWPATPVYGQLEQGAELEAQHVDLESWWSPWEPVARETLVLGEHFDQVVSALPLPCLPHVAPDLVAHAAWAPAVEAMEGIATIAAQMWTERTTQELGFPKLAGTDRVCATAAVSPLGLADMSDVLAAENWPAEGGPRGLVYLCGPLAHRGPWPAADQHDTPALFDDQSKATFVQWLRTAVSVMPAAGTQPFTPEAFDLAGLWCPADDEGVGQARVDRQYWRANIDPCERYVPSPPGSGSLRPQAWQSGATNLALASDWIFTGMNIGSFEGAVMSGLLAAHALTGAPTLGSIVGYAFARPDLVEAEAATTLAAAGGPGPG
ncbi:MAG TPA: FAD-dependent oxidoreductase [Acidimicrobiales bacterium]|nr:FAD-dependent oxidoreductase [Acidimicrobiales bacterium]